ncbi:MAG: hypothetical protein CL769_00045 [Chloroflexi bacterium]|nr:hypothetical protein [Chloroflexota bacterium]
MNLNISDSNFWKIFLIRDYSLLWFSSFTTMLSMQLRIIATGFILYEITGSGLSLGMLGIIQLFFQLPSILYGGVLADFFKRTTIIIISQSVGTTIIFILFYLTFNESINQWHIYIATALLSINSTIGGPARSALTANLVPKKLLINAVAANTATTQIGSVLAPILFGILTVSLGASYPLLIGSVVALISAITCIFIRNDNYIKNKNKMSPVKNIVEGFIYVKEHPILPGLYLLDIGVTVVSFYRQIMPLIADRLFKGGAAVVSILTAFNSIGAIAGSFLVVFLSKIKSKGLLVLGATFIYGILLIFFGLSTSIFFGALFITLLGATDAVGMTVRQAIVQLTSPDHLRGRAVSLHSVAAMTANNIGHFEIGITSELIGTRNALFFGGIVSCIVVFIIWKTFKGVGTYKLEV